MKPRTKTRNPDEKKCPYSGSLADGAVIVYVWRQRDTEVVGEYLNSSGVSGGVVIYHGGMDTNARSKAQSKVRRRL
jgi:superfamily II DNA helicase RecQ